MYLFSRFVVLFSLLTAANSTPACAQTDAPTSSVTNASPYAVVVSQPDGTSLRITGKGNQEISYTETADGYTVLKNEQQVYEYAKSSENGKLIASGIKVRNPDERSPEETQFLQTIPLHLRHKPPYVDSLRKSIN